MLLTVRPFASFALPLDSIPHASLLTASGINLFVLAANAIPIFFSFIPEDFVPKTLDELRNEGRMLYQNSLYDSKTYFLTLSYADVSILILNGGTASKELTCQRCAQTTRKLSTVISLSSSSTI